MTRKAIKYNFECSFDEGADDAASIAAADRAAELEAARQLAYAEGFAAGEEQMRASLDAQMARAHARIEAQLTALVSSLNAMHRAVQADAARCIGALAEAVAGEALLHLPVDRIEGVVAPILSELLEAPRLVLRVCPALLDGVKHRLEDVAIALGFGGKLIFLAEDQLEPGDVLIEWANGGLDARLEQTREKIRTAIEDFIQSALSGTLPKSPPPTANERSAL